MLACGGSPPVSEAPEVVEERPDVVLITLDTTRADRIGAYGYEGAATDNIDALAARGRRYSTVYSPLPLTIPSHGALFTGRYPPNFGVRANGDGWISTDERMLAEVMTDAGFATVASVGAFVTTREWGFGQGFETYFENVPREADFWHAERRGERVVDDLLEWKKARPEQDSRPVFAWVHMYDPHFPFESGEPWISETEGRPYDAEIAYVDDQVGRIVEAFGPDAIYVIAADHGEGLGDHGELAHGLFVFNVGVRVPWIIAGPGVEAQVVDQPASLVDVTPTLLDLLGLEPMKRADGRVAPSAEPAPIYTESWQLQQRFGLAPHVAVIADGHKLIDLPTPELYAVDDYLERTDLSESDPDRVAAMKEILDGFGFEAPSADAAHPSTPAMTRQLEALGYVEGGYLGEASLEDPKEHTELIALVQRLEIAGLEGNQEEANAITQKLAADYPDVVEFQMKLARIEAHTGKLGQATKRMQDLISKDPDNALAIHFLGTLLAGQGKFEEAAARFQDAADRMPYAPRLRVMAVAALFASEGGTKAGFELAKTYLADDKDDYDLCGLLGVELIRNRQMEQGLKLLNLGLKAEVPERDVAYLLAASATGQGDLDRAMHLLELELKSYPGNSRALMALLRLEGKKGLWHSQIARLETWLSGHGRAFFAREHQPALPEGADPELVPAAAKTDPAMADLLHIYAQALFNVQRYDQARAILDRGLDIDPDRANLLLLDANLLAQLGDREAGVRRFEEAKAAKAREEAAQRPDPWAGLEERKVPL